MKGCKTGWPRYFDLSLHFELHFTLYWSFDTFVNLIVELKHISKVLIFNCQVLVQGTYLNNNLLFGDCHLRSCLGVSLSNRSRCLISAASLLYVVFLCKKKVRLVAATRVCWKKSVGLKSVRNVLEGKARKTKNGCGFELQHLLGST